LAVQQIEKEVETHDSCVQALVNSDSLNTANLSYRLDAGLKTITTSIQKFGEVIVFFSFFIDKADSISTVTGQYNSTIWRKRASSDTSTLDVYLLLQIQLYIVN
jgi:hypothetical protein